jgi:DNA-binding CsgD family transcriptional regulator
LPVQELALTAGLLAQGVQKPLMKVELAKNESCFVPSALNPRIDVAAKPGAFARSLQHHLVEVLLLRMVFMSEAKQSRLSPAQRTEIWRRWKAGESLREMGRACGKSPNCIRCVLLPRGRIAPAARQRSHLALTLAEREDISRGIASGSSIRTIASGLGRAASTVSREVTRHGGLSRPRCG